jgi:hypothetical protein
LLETCIREEWQSILKVAKHEYDNVHHANGMTDLSLAIVVIGVIAATFGLGCTTVGLLGNWREWAKTHFPYTAGLGRRI